MKNVGWIIFGTAVAIGLGWAIYEKVKSPLKDRTWADKIFMEKFGKPSNPTYGNNYVIAWAEGLFNGTPTFMLEGKTYDTKTGKQTS